MEGSRSHSCAPTATSTCAASCFTTWAMPSRMSASSPPPWSSALQGRTGSTRPSARRLGCWCCGRATASSKNRATFCSKACRGKCCLKMWPAPSWLWKACKKSTISISGRWVRTCTPYPATCASRICTWTKAKECWPAFESAWRTSFTSPTRPFSSSVPVCRAHPSTTCRSPIGQRSSEWYANNALTGGLGGQVERRAALLVHADRGVKVEVGESQRAPCALGGDVDQHVPAACEGRGKYERAVAPHKDELADIGYPLRGWRRLRLGPRLGALGAHRHGRLFRHRRLLDERDRWLLDHYDLGPWSEEGNEERRDLREALREREVLRRGQDTHIADLDIARDRGQVGKIKA